MSYSYHGTNGIIVLPGRNVETFPSGLVRVDRRYACRADRADVVRREFAVGNLLPYDDGTPSIDGLYIFPDPKETQRDDGFVEFGVSGYGRSNTTGYSRREFVLGETTFTLDATVVAPDGTVTTTNDQSSITTLNEAVIQTFVQLAEQPFLLEIGIAQDDLKVYLSNGQLLTEAYPSSYRVIGTVGYSRVTTGTSPIFGGVTSTNFGRWAEVTITYNSVGYSNRRSYVVQ